MQRRSFLQSLAIAAVSVKTLFGQKAHAAKPTNLDSQPEIILGAGREFLLPSNPKPEQKLRFIVGDDWATHPPVVKGNGQPIMGKTQDLSLDTNVSFNLVYKGPERGWMFY